MSYSIQTLRRLCGGTDSEASVQRRGPCSDPCHLYCHPVCIGPRITWTSSSEEGKIIASVIPWPHHFIMHMAPVTRIKGISGMMQRKSWLKVTGIKVAHNGWPMGRCTASEFAAWRLEPDQTPRLTRPRVLNPSIY